MRERTEHPADETMAADETAHGTLDVTPTGSSPGSIARSGAAVGADIAIGDRLGDYEIVRRLGAGGMGEVYAARPSKRRGLGRREGLSGALLGTDADDLVALKVLGRASPTALYRFKREFRALADVEHPNLISLVELVVPREGKPFFTMELVDGPPFTEYVRGRTPPGQLPNLVRLARALRQLLDGVHHLHLSQFLHRDLKPSNVLVNREGRVVVLDFGLVSELTGKDEGLTHDGALIGTPAYMSPEQALSGTAGPAADIYGIGVMLFECLTGELPFKGSSLQVMLDKQAGEIPDPGARVTGIPEPLRELCMRMMALDPESRPSGRELIEAMAALVHAEGGQSSSGSSAGDSASGQLGTLARGPRTPSPGASMSVAVSGPGPSVSFVGRKAELAHLEASLRDLSEARSAVTVHLHGASGFGKSALLSRFLSRARRKSDALILSSRCLERESVPYKGVDALIDALSVQLRRMHEHELAALQPPNLAALTRIFPVLMGVWRRKGQDQGQGQPGAPAPAPPQAEAAELRRLGLGALRALLQRMSQRRPLVLAIDDFQWADLDSVRLLTALMRPPEPPSVLLVLSFRDDLEPRSEAMAELRSASAVAGRDVRELHVGALAPEDALELTVQLLGEGTDRAQARALVERTGANPFFLGQLAIGSDLHPSQGGEGRVQVSLDEVVARRIVDLDPLLRRLIALVAIAGGPLPRPALDALHGNDVVVLDALLGELVRLGLLRRTRTHGSLDLRGSAALSLASEASDEAIDAAHGRIREVVLCELEADERRGLHLELAQAIEPLGADRETLAEHLARGGEAERAAALAEQAAKAAADALAFARAVELYERTLELLPPTAPGAKRRALRLALAQQRINLGHGAAAAEIILELAVVAKPEQARGLHRRAAEQLLRAGRLDEGLDLSRGLFEDVGEPMPRSFRAAVWMILRQRLRLWWRDRWRRPQILREESEVPKALLDRLDVLLNVATGLALQDVILTQAFHARALVLAREAGEPRRLGLVLSQEHVVHAATGQLHRARLGLVDARELAAKVRDPELDRAIDLAEAMVEWFSHRMPEARQRLAELSRRMQAAPGADWVRAYAAIRYAETCVYTGELAELRRELPRWLTTASEHGNLHELASLAGIGATVMLDFDDGEAAQRLLDEGREVWEASRYTIPDLTLDLSGINVHLFAGELDQAFALAERVAGQLRASGMHHVPLIREQVVGARGRCAMRAALRAPGDGKRVQAFERALGERSDEVDPLQGGETQLMWAALHSLRGDEDLVRRSLRRAAGEFERFGMQSRLAAAQLRLADMTHGHESAELREAGESYLRFQGIQDPRRFVEWVSPLYRR
ncbi:eukaryotic-type protein kinase [Plesiocystis pacifica SIR-1]|uniref:Eukaryotic-type protein kinase n=1 Tax=Plesiocystis pacifica SIR-1 TaxID=391625 RepID=A6G843_9BACT|nr:serine/threonine-protein kinase [Plesiocystis pacifica]EDM78005.1 eukaryotic-type protein kinase [Plesiocystis pacifica SIR-1]